MKPGTRTPLIVAAAVAVAVIAGTFIMRGSADRAAVAATEVEAMPAASDAPSRGPAAAAPVTGTGAGGTPADSKGVANHIERREALRAEQQARTRALRQQSEQRFASEQVDPAWAPQKETELNDIATGPAFQTADAQPQSMSVSCRSSMCRLDGQFETSGKAEDWLLMYMSSVGGAMPHSVVSRSVNPDGTTRVEIYGRAR